MKTRLIVLSDITSLTAGVREPDDGQSMIRLMLYANDLEIQGLIASSNLGHGQTVRPELIAQVVDAYGKALPNLLKHSSSYPRDSILQRCIKAGQPAAGPKVSIWDSIGKGKDTEASNWIIDAVDKEDPRPVWISIWGGSADLAQALWTVSNTRSPSEVDEFVSKIRVHACHEQDSTGPWIKENFPRLFYITRANAIRGMYHGGDTSLVSAEWVRTHVHGHGPLGDLYPCYDGGDPWGAVKGIKEGDTPTFLSLLPTGLNDLNNPSHSSWGGRFVRDSRWSSPCHLTDAYAGMHRGYIDDDPCIVEVNRWRPAYQGDFQARLDWCIHSYDQANHPPVPVIAQGTELWVHPADFIDLDASSSIDPDGRGLAFQWSILPEGDVSSAFIEGKNSAKARVSIPDTANGLLPVLLAVSNSHPPESVRYVRVNIHIEP